MSGRPAIERGSVLAGRYRIEHMLGRGGFAEVYLARHVEIDSLRVAIKVLHASHSCRELILDRFKREASLLALLRNRHTVGLVDFGFTEERVPFLVMEYVEGAPLDRVLQIYGRLRETDVCRMAIHVLKALAEAHAAGVVHRDLKPANIFLVEEPGEHHPVARVLDFGIAKVMGDPEVVRTIQLPAALSSATATDLVFCTPLYAAPELLRGNPDFRTDLYALGLVMAEVLDGAPPYGARACGFEHSPHLDPSPVPLGPMASKSALAEIIRRACSKDLEQRYPTAVEMMAELEITYGRIKQPDFNEEPLQLGIPSVTREMPVVQARGTQELQSQFVEFVGDDQSTSQLLSETVAANLGAYLPELSFEARPLSGFVPALPLGDGPRTIEAKRGRAMVSRVVAAAIVGMFGVIALSATNESRGSVSLMPAIPVLAAPEVRAAIAPEFARDLSSESVMVVQLAEPLEFEISPPESDAAYEAAEAVAAALNAAPSACIRLVADAPATVRVDGEDLAALVQRDGQWSLPVGTTIPVRRPLVLTVRGPGVVASQEVSDSGPVDIRVDLQSLRADLHSPDVEPEATSRRERTRRSGRRVASSRSDRSSQSGEETGSEALPELSLLGPPVSPRTR